MCILIIFSCSINSVLKVTRAVINAIRFVQFCLSCVFLFCRYNNYDRSVINTVPRDVVRRWYTAHRQLTAELRRPDNELWVKLKPGQGIVVGRIWSLKKQAIKTTSLFLFAFDIMRDKRIAKYMNAWSRIVMSFLYSSFENVNGNPEHISKTSKWSAWTIYFMPSYVSYWQVKGL